MSYFPIILIPQQIEQVRSAQPPVPAPPNQPQKPKPKPQKVNTSLVAIETAIAAITVPIASQITSIPGWILLLVAVGAIAAHVWHQITTYPQRQQKYKDEFKGYLRELEDYERKKGEHEEEVKAARSPERVAEFRYKLLMQILSQTVPHDGNDSIATKGQAEALFGNHLSQYFPGKIHKGLTLKIPDFDYPYTPDFAYIDTRLKLYIDIELDEPYVYHTGAATHYLEAWKDNNRNNFFLNKGWVVIRFSEEQIICYPHSCCKTVAQVITQITGDTSILNQCANIADLQQQRQWTQREALEMAASKKRDNYPCHNKISNTNPVLPTKSLIKSKPTSSQSLPPNSLGLTRPQRNRAEQVTHSTKNLSISSKPNNTTSQALSLLANCPYCGVKVKSTKLKSHKISKCPKRPNL